MKKILLDIINKNKWLYLIQITFLMINIYLLTIPAEIIGKIIDLLYDVGTNKQEIIHQTIILLVLSIVLLAVRLVWKYFETYLARYIEKDVKDKIFDNLIKLNLTEILGIKNGELMSYFVQDIRELRVISLRLSSHFTRIIFISIFATWAMIRNVNLKLTILTLLPIVLTVVFTVKIKTYIERSYKKSRKYFTQLSEYIQESTDAIRTTKAYSVEDQQIKEFIKINKKLRGADNSVDAHSALLSSIVQICFGLCYGISILYGSNLILNGTITVGDFVAFNTYITLFINPVNWLPGLVSRFKRAQVAYKRLDKVLSLEKENIEIDKTYDELSGDIEIRDLSFGYSDNTKPVLKNVSLNIRKGETLGIIGTIGSGKTTLMNLLLRLYTIENGKIFIDRKDIKDIPLKQLRDSIVYITQDNFLFSTTLKENINLFKDIYNDDEIEDSIKKSMIYDEIMNMNDGIDTVIGERGIDLSGGQKQRVVISRAFLNKSNIVIFDDTFSALDNKTEKSVLENVKEMASDKTCIIISNRISDIRDATKIVVLKNGEIVETGNHNELLENRQDYYKFFIEQSSQGEESLF